MTLEQLVKLPAGTKLRYANHHENTYEIKETGKSMVSTYYSKGSVYMLAGLVGYDLTGLELAEPLQEPKAETKLINRFEGMDL